MSQPWGLPPLGRCAIASSTGIIATRSGRSISSSPFSRSVALWLPWWPTL